MYVYLICSLRECYCDFRVQRRKPVKNAASVRDKMVAFQCCRHWEFGSCEPEERWS